MLEAGFAVNDQELAPGLHSIPDPCATRPARSSLRSTWRRTPRWSHSREDLVDHLAPHLVSTADRISARLGHRRDHERST